VKEGVGVLFLEDEEHKKRIFPASQLAMTLRGAGVRVVVMDACKSAMRDPVNIWTGIAPLLMRFEVSAAVGMQYSILDKAAVSFSRLLYHSLAVGMPLDEAVTHARIAIYNTEPLKVGGRSYQTKWDWGLPALYLAAEDGIIFPELTSDRDLEPLRVEVRQRTDVLRGKMLAGTIEEMYEGEARFDQYATTVESDGEMKGPDVERMEGGKLTSEQGSKELRGTMIGPRMGSLGGPSRPSSSERAASTTLDEPKQEPPPISQQTVYYVAVGDERTGPYDLQSLRQHVQQGTLTRDSLVWTESRDGWGKAGDVDELQSLFASESPSLPSDN
jgi:hypothetical protein